MFTTGKRIDHYRRRGAVAALTAVSGTVLVGFIALTVDLGVLYNVRAELQRTADAAAMAGAWEMVLARQNEASEEEVLAAARDRVLHVARLNRVQGRVLEVDENPGNDPDGDVVLGYLENATNRNAPLDTSDPSRFNTVMVTVRRSEIRNGPVQLFFAQIFGVRTGSVEATAAATFRDGVVGFNHNGSPRLLPFALHVDAWNGLLDGTFTTGDSFGYDRDTGLVTAGRDGELELNLYPGGGSGQLPPGNFGTVNIGTSGGSASTLSRQILEGVDAEDLEYHGGELVLGEDGTLSLGGQEFELSGDPGLSASIEKALLAIKGQARIIPLFDEVSGSGNNAVFRIVGFAGIRIMDVKLTGSMSKKRVIIQPSHVMDDSAIAGSGSSYFVYEPVRLSR
jgi:Flp pilus assembly protein TadG